jgi:YfaZ precursor
MASKQQCQPTSRLVSSWLGAIRRNLFWLGGARAPRGAAVASLFIALLALDARVFSAEGPPPRAGNAYDLFAGQHVLQFVYETQGPISGMANNLDLGFLLSKNRDLIGSGALMFNASYLQFHRLRVEVGPRADIALLNTNNTDIVAFYAGADASIELIRRLHLSVYGSAFWAPAVLIFGQGKSVTDFIAGGRIELVQHLSVLAGYRWFRFYLTNGPSENVDNTAFVGFRWSP